MKLDVWNGCHNLQWCYLLKEEGNCMYCLSWSWHLVFRFTTTCAISAYHHLSCEVESSSWRGVLKTILCYNVCQCLAAGRRFFVGIAVSWANKTDRHDIAKILLKVMLNLITLTLHRCTTVIIPITNNVASLMMRFSCFCTNKNDSYYITDIAVNNGNKHL